MHWCECHHHEYACSVVNPPASRAFPQHRRSLKQSSNAQTIVSDLLSGNTQSAGQAIAQASASNDIQGIAAALTSATVLVSMTGPMPDPILLMLIVQAVQLCQSSWFELPHYAIASEFDRLAVCADLSNCLYTELQLARQHVIHIKNPLLLLTCLTCRVKLKQQQMPLQQQWQCLALILEQS